MIDAVKAGNYLASIKVWSIPENISRFNPSEYRRRFTKNHIFVTKNVYTHKINPFGNDFMFETRMYVNEYQFDTFYVSHRYVFFTLDIILRENIDFWLGSLAARALINYETLSDNCTQSHNLYTACDPDTEYGRVTRYLQVDIIPPTQKGDNMYYHYDWLAGVNDEELHYQII